MQTLQAPGRERGPDVDDQPDFQMAPNALPTSSPSTAMPSLPSTAQQQKAPPALRDKKSHTIIPLDATLVVVSICAGKKRN